MIEGLHEVVVGGREAYWGRIWGDQLGSDYRKITIKPGDDLVLVFLVTFPFAWTQTEDSMRSY